MCKKHVTGCSNYVTSTYFHLCYTQIKVFQRKLFFEYLRETFRDHVVEYLELAR